MGIGKRIADVISQKKEEVISNIKKEEEYNRYKHPDIGYVVSGKRTTDSRRAKEFAERRKKERKQAKENPGLRIGGMVINTRASAKTETKSLKEQRLSKARKIARKQAYKKAYTKELINEELRQARKQAREDAKVIVSTSRDEPARTTRTRTNTGAPILNRGFAPASPFVKKR